MARRTTISELPHITCPVCHGKFEIMDPEDYVEGDDIECPECERKLLIQTIEYTAKARVCDHPEND